MGYIKEGVYNYLIVVVFLVVIEIFMFMYYRKNGLTIKKGFLFGWQIFALLMVIIMSVTGAGCIRDIGRYGTKLIRMDEISLIPFVWAGEGMMGIILNAVMFIPFGAFLPMLYEKGANFKETVLVGFTFSLLIELSQLFNRRVTDIDDLIMNTLGTLIGYGIYCLCLKSVKLFKLDNSLNKVSIKNTAIITVISIFVFYFFIGNPLVRYFWIKLYNF